MVARTFIFALATGLMFAGCAEEEGPDTSCVYEFSIDKDVDPARFPEIEDFDDLSCKDLCREALGQSIQSLEKCTHSFEYEAMATIPDRGHVTCSGETDCD